MAPIADASAESLQYSSTGVREQTAELSSSFLSDSDISSRISSERRPTESDVGLPREHGTIQERSEPVSPSGSGGDVPSASELTAALRSQDPSEVGGSSTQAGAEMIQPHEDPTLRIPDVVISDEDGYVADERSPLLPRERLSSTRKPVYDAAPDLEDQRDEDGSPNGSGHYYPSVRNVGTRIRHAVKDPKQWDLRMFGRKVIYEPACMLPAVFLGLLLNLLDALSYGIILFPLGEEVFKDLGPDGVSMFYVSCIISQLVYSSGSIFKGGVGSEMIEVVPFFHKMTYMIMAQMGT